MHKTLCSDPETFHGNRPEMEKGYPAWRQPLEENDIYMNGISVKNYLIRGASREREIDYPNRQWGYGQVDVYNSFLILTRS